MSADERFDRLLAQVLADGMPSRPPDRLLPESLRALRDVRRWPRWLAYLKETPMRISDRLAVGSPAVRVAFVVLSILLLTVLATGAALGAAALLSGPASIVVAQDGSGQARTIPEAVAMAEDGDIVRVMPGTYPEHVVVDKAIIIEGDPESDREAIVVTFTVDSPPVRGCLLWTTPGCGEETESEIRLPTAISLEGTNATVRHLRLEGPDHGIAVAASGGDVLIEDLSIELSGVFMGIGRYGVFVYDDATGTLRDITCACSVGISTGSSPTVERLTQTPIDPLIINGPGSDPLVRDSTLGKVWVQEGAHPSLTGNTISMEVSVGAGEVPEPPTVAELRDNVIDGAANDQPYGVQTDSGSLVLVGNTITRQVTGLDIGAGDSPTVQGNTFEGNATAINVNAGESELPDVLTGITGNTLCGNVTTLRYYGGSEDALADNEVCDADLAASQ